MANTENLYAGADYGLQPPSYGPAPTGYQVQASTIGLATDARTANQVQEVQKKLRTGAKTIEVSPSLELYQFESIPKQQFDEINRLRKLAGVDLTFHGPMIEPSGFNPRAGNWDESQRKQAEIHLLDSVKRGHRIDPDGNLVITFHTAYAIPETNPTMKLKTEKGDKITKTGVAYIDEESGRTGFIQEEEMKLLGKKMSPNEIVANVNERNWSSTLGNINIHLIRTRQVLEGMKIDEKELQGLKLLKEDSKKYDEYISKISEKSPERARVMNDVIERVSEAEVDVRDAYNRLNEAFNTAYKNAEKEDNKPDIKKLNDLKDSIGKTLEKNKGDVLLFKKLRDQVSQGLRVLNEIEAPQTFRPLKEFALEKGALTYGNVAYQAYKEYKDKAPIISIENPPYGQSALATGEDLREMVKLTREKFVDKAMKDGKISKSEAERQAKKLIGATWDVGHINLLRKYGYNEKDIIEQTKKIAPYVKHVHLSDNFGMEHTELPMGMGNVPGKEMLKIISKYNEKVKKISETGGAWYQFFRKEPLMEQFSALGSPIYSTSSSPAWSEQHGMMSSYFGGLGNFLPEQHFSTYGSGFSNLPTELGGQVGGITDRSRFTGTPME